MSLKEDLESIKVDISPEEEKSHLWKIWGFTKFFWLAGLCNLTNIWGAISLSLGIFGNWTILGHHGCHGGLVGVDRLTYGRGMDRIISWLDWWDARGWSYEHNHLHHYFLSEEKDPDLVERNLEWLRDSKMSFLSKRAIVLFLATSWKWIYYAPNINENSKIKYFPQKEYLFFYYFLVPYCYYLRGYNYAFFWMVAVEIITNLHSFLVIVPNHAGDDLYRFTEPCILYSNEYYRRQIVSSSNFYSGNDIVDYLHGWLNYQIEHHIFPDKGLLWYRKAAPLVREICNKHSLNYTKQNVFIRLVKTIDIMIGKTSMKRENTPG